MAPSELLREVRWSGIYADVAGWRQDLRDWRQLESSEVARQWKELLDSAPAPRTPRLYSTHLRLEETERQRRQLRREGLVNAVLVGNLQACEEGSYAANGTTVSLRAPLSRLVRPRHKRRPCGAGRVQVVQDQDLWQLARALAKQGWRCAVVHVLPQGRDMRESPMCLRTPKGRTAWIRLRRTCCVYIYYNIVPGQAGGGSFYITYRIAQAEKK